MFVRVLGSAAGGGFPQWNCGCANCSGLRAGKIRAQARTQESVAVSADGVSYFLLNASPEIRQQIEAAPCLHPRALRDTRIAGIVLTNGDLDHCLGLLSLRESQRLVVYATERVRRGFVEGNVFYRTLERFEGQVTWRGLELGRALRLAGPDGVASGLELSAFAVLGKPPLHARETDKHPEDNIGLSILDEQRSVRLVYAPGVAGPSAELAAALGAAHAVFFDGTFWSQEELVGLGVGRRNAADMAHWPVGESDGSLEFLRGLGAARKLLIHVNNTNPILREDSPERRALAAAGVEVAEDGLEFSL